MDCTTIIARAKTQLMLRHPFFGALAMGLQFKEADIPTMATDGKSIQYSVSFVEAQGPELITGVIAHEVMHVAFKHMLRRGEYNHEVWNMACDYAINLIVTDAGRKLPEEGLLDEQYRDMSAEAIYARLLEEGAEAPSNGWNFGGVNQASGSGDSTDSDQSGQGLTEADVQAISAQVDVQVANALSIAEAIGSVPAGIDELISELGKPSIDWRDKLRTFVGGDQPDDYTFARCNRKWIQHGIYMPSVQHFGVGHLAVVVDTSRSLNNDILSVFLGELNALSEDMSPESVTVIGCDASVQSVTEYEAGDIIESLDATGRGGTRVTPAFQYIDEHIPHVDQVIYLTDLYVNDFPDEPEYPVLWCSVGKQTAPWGEVVRVQP